MTQQELESVITNAIQKALESVKTSRYSEEELYLTSNEACELLKIGKTKLFELKKEGVIPFIKEGRKLLFVKRNLIEYRNSILRKIK